MAKQQIQTHLSCTTSLWLTLRAASTARVAASRADTWNISLPAPAKPGDVLAAGFCCCSGCISACCCCCWCDAICCFFFLWRRAAPPRHKRARARSTLALCRCFRSAHAHARRVWLDFQKASPRRSVACACARACYSAFGCACARAMVGYRERASLCVVCAHHALPVSLTSSVQSGFTTITPM